MSTLNHKSKQEAAFQKLGNFCSSYKLTKADEMLCRIFTVMLAGNYSKQSNFNRKRFLDYLEELEEVLPALYELQQVQKSGQDEAGLEHTYQDEVASQNLYASFKRHPE